MSTEQSLKKASKKKNNAKMPVKQLSNICNANKRHASFAMPLQDIFCYKNKRYEKERQVKNIFEMLIGRQRNISCFVFMLLYIAYYYK